MKSHIEREFWAAEALEPIRLLGDLRAFVLARSHTRLPRWHFRLAPHFVLRLQPKPAERRDRFWAFECEAFEGAGLTRAACESRSGRVGLAVWRLRFGIVIPAVADGTADPPRWVFRPAHLWWPRDTSGAVAVAGDRAAAARAFRARIIAALRGGGFDHLRPEMMWSPNCLICGKALTDPVSIARWIGPECAGTGSLNIPTIPLVQEIVAS